MNSTASRGSPRGRGVGANRREALAEASCFRGEFYECPTARRDELFELVDAVLCVDGAVKSPVDLTLSPDHRRRHGAMYGGLNHGRIDIDRLFCHACRRAKTASQFIPGRPCSFVGVLEPGATSWTAILDAARPGRRCDRGHAPQARSGIPLRQAGDLARARDHHSHPHHQPRQGRAVRVGFVVSGEAAVVHQPAEGPLDDPVSRDDLEALVAWVAAGDLDIDAEDGALVDGLGPIAGVSPGPW